MVSWPKPQAGRVDHMAASPKLMHRLDISTIYNLLL
jgi:hypothetical protein